MNLNTWLFQKNISKADFARLLDISRTHMSLVIHKRTSCGKKLAARIEQHTGGQVKASEMRKGTARRKTVKQSEEQLDAFRVAAL